MFTFKAMNVYACKFAKTTFTKILYYLYTEDSLTDKKQLLIAIICFVKTRDISNEAMM